MTTDRRPSARPWRLTALLAALAAGLVVAAGCGSGSSGDGSTKANNGVPQGVALAESVVRTATARPTSVGVAQPIGKEVPTGKKVAFISCGVEACTVQGKIIAQGAKDLGWTSSMIATDGTPEKLQQAFDTAMRRGANAVILNGVSRAVVSKQIAEAKKQGVAFVTCCSTESVGDGILYNTEHPAAGHRDREDLAAQVVANTKGKANALYVNITAFEILKNLGTLFERSYKSYCPTCDVASIDIPLTALGKDAPDRIVSYLRATRRSTTSCCRSVTRWAAAFRRRFRRPDSATR